MGISSGISLVRVGRLVSVRSRQTQRLVVEELGPNRAGGQSQTSSEQRYLAGGQHDWLLEEEEERKGAGAGIIVQRSNKAIRTDLLPLVSGSF